MSTNTINEYRLVDLLTTLVPVPPTTIRPSVVLSTTKSNEDDLTIKIKSMLFHNSQLGSQADKGDDFYKFLKDSYMLQCHYFHYFNSDVTGLPHTEMKDKKAIRGLY
jgi:DNA-directed RNA polymerase beta' subunit